MTGVFVAAFHLNKVVRQAKGTSAFVSCQSNGVTVIGFVGTLD